MLRLIGRLLVGIKLDQEVSCFQIKMKNASYNICNLEASVIKWGELALNQPGPALKNTLEFYTHTEMHTDR